MFLALLIPLVIAISGCATTKVYTQDGKAAHAVKCKTNRTNCLIVAGKTCRESGFTIIVEDQAESANGGGAVVDGYGGSSFEIRQNYGMIFRCNETGAH